MSRHAAEPRKRLPPQEQELPGEQAEMRPQPASREETYRGCAKLAGRVAIITGATAASAGPSLSPLPARELTQSGKDVPMGRPAQPEEIAPSSVFLASDDSSYYTGEILALTGGETTAG